MKKKKKRGMALITTLAVLTLLMSLTLGVTTLLMYETKTTDELELNVLSEYAVESGINFAIIQLRKEARTNFIDDPSEPWYYDPSNPSKPSYNNFDGSGNGHTYITNVTGRQIITSLYIYDLSGRININDIQNAYLKDLLEDLVAVIGPPLDTGDGIAIANEAQTNGPFESLGSILKRVPQIDKAELNALKPYITLYSYIDPTTINPRITPVLYQNMPRSPININTAPKEVLQALFRNIVGYNICPNCNGDGRIQGQGAIAWCGACGRTGNLTITDTEANYLAQWIINERAVKPFTTYEDFYKRLKAASVSKSPNGTSPTHPVGECDADLVLAIANPNPGIDMGVRDYSWGHAAGFVPKAELIPLKAGVTKGLLKAKTEVRFSSGGWYEIECHVQIKNNVTGVIEAKRAADAYVKIFDIVKQTTQQDFTGPGTNNIHLATYPENLHISGTKPASFDGWITRAFKNWALDSHITLYVPLTNGKITADPVSKGNKVPTVSENINANVSVFNVGTPSSLLVNGLRISKGKREHLSYEALKNVNPKEGTIGVWVKLLTEDVDDRGIEDYNESDRVIFHLVEQSTVPAYLCYSGTKLTWYKNTKPDDGRKTMQLWFWTASAINRTQWVATGSLGTTSKWGTPNNREWFWMHMPSMGINKLLGRCTRKGEWMYFVLSYTDGGKDATELPNPEAGTAASNPWWHWNYNDTHKKNPEAGIAGRNLFDWHAGENYNTIRKSADERWFYLNGNKMTYSGIYGFDIQNYCKMGPFDSTNAYFSLGYNYWGYGHVLKKEEANGVFVGLRIWDKQRTDAQIMSDYLEGVYLDIPSVTETFISRKVVTKPKDALWGCVAWTQYTPNGVDEIRIDVSNNRGSWKGNLSTPGGASLNGLLNDNLNDLYYRVRFLPRGGCITETTVFDDISFTYIDKPVIRNYHEVD